MQWISRLALVFAIACFIAQPPQSADAKDATRVQATELKAPVGTVHAVRPDLVVSAITYSPSTPVTGSETTLRVVFRNVGKGIAQASKARVRVGGDPNPPLIAVPSLNAGQQWQYIQKITFSRPTIYLVKAEADVPNTLLESRENNNDRTINVPVKSGKPDLVVTKINHSPGIIKVGDQVTLWVFVKNTGLGRADVSDATIGVGWTQPHTPTEFPVTVPALNPGQEKRFTKKFTYELAGNHPISVAVDTTDKLDEFDETNNHKMKVVEVK